MMSLRTTIPFANVTVRQASKGRFTLVWAIQNESAENDEMQLLKQLVFLLCTAVSELLCRRLPRRSPADKFVHSHTT